MDIPNIEYDRFGRMKYNPQIHSNTGKPWSEEDLQYLVDWYYIIGPEEMSYALERTSTAVSNKVIILTKKGVMVRPKNRNWHRRIKKRDGLSHQ
ncbi:MULTISPECIES: hypothetical protein [Clostridium]|uniref:Uncharacterized protein n=2 Tax=Clostridium botulinum TaxID=1491 RepID=M1ZRU4_CLOBO|nr:MULTISPECIES: hypothetical protein [Clostridium]EKN36260.1 hypothetical protein CFSAN001627_27278 [Clostridium botulinum CFSAN001627]APC85739.1 hypothetical protein NPD12_3072 [Clostridium botulinum]MBY6773151.1 hypothetical protein [Clostridium botulinum]MBY6776768.1 hypothetical protein [Clostridium botulinum]MBY6783917.1 hypothetical protein [Clostridium botulinum]